MPTEPEVFALADHALNSVVQQIGDDQWQLAIPEWIKLGRVSRDGLTLRALLNYHAYDDAWVPAMVAGKTMDAVGAGKWKHEDLLGEDPKKKFAAIVETAASAALAVTPVFGPAVPVPADAPLQDKLLGLTGRQPQH